MSVSSGEYEPFFGELHVPAMANVEARLSARLAGLVGSAILVTRVGGLVVEGLINQLREGLFGGPETRF